MADGKIYITISDRQGPGGGENPTESSQKKDKKNWTDTDYITHKVYDFIKDQAKQALVYGVSNIGNFTGDYIAQRQSSELMQITSKIAAIGMAFSVNPIVGIIATAGTAISSLLERNTQMLQNAKTNYNIDQLRRRAGLSGLDDGNRTGD